MRIEKVDLYDYFKVSREGSNRGFLTCYLLDNDKEVNLSRKHPSIVVFPGGGYFFTSFREKEPVALAFLNKGFNVFVLDYYCFENKACYPSVIKEAMMAVKYVRDNLNEFNGYEEGVSGVGFSAGGHLLGLVSSIKDNELDLLGFSREDVKLNGAIFSYPVISSRTDLTHKDSFYNLTLNDPKLLYSLSIENRVDASFPPSFIWHTLLDHAVNPSNSSLLKECLDKFNVVNELKYFRKGEHGGSVATLMCYREDQIKDVPSINSSWVDLACAFLLKQGVKIID